MHGTLEYQTASGGGPVPPFAQAHVQKSSALSGIAFKAGLGNQSAPLAVDGAALLEHEAKPLPPQFDQIRQFIAERYGFWIKDSWAGQFSTRVSERMALNGANGLGVYLERLKESAFRERETKALVHGLLNHETHFNRNRPHFDMLRSVVVPSWRRFRADQKLRIASLGCSTGEEPYTIALTLAESLSAEELARVEITAVDASPRALAVARAARYVAFQLRELDERQRARWFIEERGAWRVKPDLQQRIRFLEHNLLEPLPLTGLDAIFCRNVIIYFQRPVVERLLAEFHTMLRPEGFLVLGHSESALDFPDLFTPVSFPETVVYRRAVKSAASMTNPAPVLN